jgi:hypothetical protein
MSQEIPQSGNIIPSGAMAFSRLAVQERDFVLTEVAASLHWTALVSRAVEDQAARDMDALADRIAREREKLAADYSPASGEVVYQALDLLDSFHRRMSS